MASPSWLATQPAHTDDQVGILLLEMLDPPQVVEDLFLGLLTHGTRIEEDHIGLFRVVRLLQPIGRPEHIRHLVRVVLVHLATEGTDIELFHHVLTDNNQTPIIAGFGW
jgi:hypothetical protein